ncbi:cupin domain-containing protein [Scytonema sp. UIC 10036]|uniref:cupin domain-containing protein n=1 Tax=Scytonema sp. UIC 10036 TaxID=2304196 RepID=UPI0012DAD013|nr:cupin domain-containing protein [Scytonema sp. UIC 10036]MUG99840.1 cupin domain-containing protein [Scytonema sp. UIC 10036]
MIIDPTNVPKETGSRYPQQFQEVVAGRIRQRLGNFAGLKNFGVNLVTLEPGSASALRHWHSHQDEFIYVLDGEVILVTDAGEQRLTSGMAAGFRAGDGNGHHLLNRSSTVAIYLEVGDRTPNDAVTYPDDDLLAQVSLDGKSWVFTHKDGTPY